MILSHIVRFRGRQSVYMSCQVSCEFGLTKQASSVPLYSLVDLLECVIESRVLSREKGIKQTTVQKCGHTWCCQQDLT